MSTIYSEGIFSRHAEKFRPYLSAVGLPETILYRPDIEVPIRKWAELMETVARHSHPSIGLEMGTAIEPPDLGVFGHTMAASNTVAQMLEVASHYLYVFSHSNQIRVDTGQKLGRHQLSIYRPKDSDLSTGCRIRDCCNFYHAKEADWPGNSTAAC